LTSNSDAALVLFSGGQDSATCLAWALDRYMRVETVAFRYGQKHSIELDCRIILRRLIAEASPKWQPRLGADHVLDLDLIGQLSGRRIHSHPDYPPIEKQYGAGAAYIPGRNLLFLSMSASVAFRRNISVLVCGASETEYSGYPDCRETSLNCVKDAINACSGLMFGIECPLMVLNKAGVWRLALSLGGEGLVETIRVHSHTCYAGHRSTLHKWGYGCGECTACWLREKGWSEFSLSCLK